MTFQAGGDVLTDTDAAIKVLIHDPTSRDGHHAVRHALSQEQLRGHARQPGRRQAIAGQEDLILEAARGLWQRTVRMPVATAANGSLL